MTDFDLYGATSGPAVSIDEPGSQYTLGVEWYVVGTAWLKGYRFWRPADGGVPKITGPIVARTWTVTGSAMPGADAAFSLSGSGWQTVLLTTPLPLLIGPSNSLRSGVHFPNGAYAATNGFFGIGGAGEGGLANGPLRAPDAGNATNLIQNLFTAGASLTFPASGSSTNYWIQPIVTDVDPGGESHSGSVTSTLGLGSVGAGSKRSAASRSTVIDLASSGTGVKRGAGAPTSTLALSSDLAGTKRSSGAATSTLALSSSATGNSDSDGTAPRSKVLCSPWALVNDVPEDVRAKYPDVNWMTYLTRASEILYYMSGRRWLGAGCTETAYLRSIDGDGTWPYHPSWGSCTCWSYGSWQGSYLYPPQAILRYGHIPGPYAIQLPMSPISTVSEVREDGVILDPSRYRLTRNGWLTRTDGGTWSVCMDTTQITYQFGEPPAEGGVQSAVELAIEMVVYDAGGQCAWPRTVTSYTRQGLAVEVANPLDFISDGRTGLPGVDMWLSAVNPYSRGQRGRVWSPDVPLANL